MENTKKLQVKKILTIAANVAVWIFLVLALLVTVLVFTAQGSEDGVPALFGKSLVTIETGSMEPTFKKGDMVLLEKIEGDDIAALPVGTVITYRAPVDLNGDGNIGDINTHRIVANDAAKRQLVTKGDNKETNPVADNESANPYTLHYSDVIGVVEEDDRIPGLGGVISFLRSSLGFFLCIVLPLILFFLYELYRFIALILAEKTKQAPVTSEQEEEIKRRAIEEYIRSQGGDKAPPATEPVQDVAADEPQSDAAEEK